MNNRVDWIDNAKALGIFLVVYGHVARGLDSANIKFQCFDFVDQLIYSFHMPLFFLLSGIFFVKNIENKSLSTFLKGKISTILYPYLVWSLIQISIQYFASSVINGDVSITDVLTFFLPRSQFWFLLVLFFIIVFNTLVFNYLRLHGLIICFLICGLIAFYAEKDSFIFKLFFHNLFFLVGVFLFHYSRFDKFVEKKSAIIYVLLLLFVSCFYTLHLQYSFLLFLITGLLGSLSLIVLCITLFNKTGFCSTLGKNSLVIYLLHILVTAFVRILFSKIFHIDNPLFHVITGTIMGIMIPHFLYEYFMKNKFKFFFQLKF
jgi:fucose 4-O-acetylase-like acetyltransferase